MTTRIDLDQCDLRLIEPTANPPAWQCSRCSRIIRTRASSPRAACRHQPPGLRERLASVATAGIAWVAHGMPRRTTEEAERVKAICDMCEFLSGGMCLWCGCFLSPKIQMATERCPLGKWDVIDPPCRVRRPSVGPVRVAIVTPVFRVGGAELWMISLCKWLDPARVRVVKIIVTLPGEVVPLAASWLPNGVELVESPIVLDDGSFDCLLTWGQNDLPRLASRVAVPIIDVQHGTYLTATWQATLVDAAIEAARRYDVRLAAVSDVCRDNFPGDLRKRIAVIQNGADPERLATTEPPETTRVRAGLPPRTKVVLFLGRVSSEKNAQALVDAVAYLPPDWHALIVGPQNTGLQRVGPRTHLIHAEANVGNWLAIADVLCQPSDYESHCLSINEAWLAGVPVVSCDYPVNRDFERRHGEMMWLVPVRPEPELLAGAIREAAKGRDDTRVARAREVARREYTAEVMGRRWSELIWSTCHQSAST